MKITSVSLTRTHKINMGDYENLGVSSTLVASVDEDDDLAKVSAVLEEELDTMLDKPIARVLRLADQRDQINDSHVWDFYQYQ